MKPALDAAGRPLDMPPRYAPACILMLMVNNFCNLACTYCYETHDGQAMSLETARRAVDWYLDRAVSGAMRRININFFGGECFLSLPVMEEVVASSRQYRPNVHKDVFFSATTNGTVASPRAERLIRDTGMLLMVSLDGTRAQNRARVRTDGEESYPQVARNLPLLASWTDVVARVTFHPGALDLVGNVRHVLELGAPKVVLCPVEEAPWHAHRDALEAAYEALGDWYLDVARQGQLPLLVTNQLFLHWAAAGRGASRPARPCGIGDSLVGIDPAGHVMPCHRFLGRPADYIGHVTEPGFRSVRAPYVHLESSDILGCATCEAAPVCGGGCRATSLRRGGSLYDAYEGFCIPMRAHARMARRLYDTLRAEGNAALHHLLANGQVLPPSLEA